MASRSSAVLLALCACVGVRALFPDQAGEVDRIETHVGPWRTAAAFPHSNTLAKATVLVTTEAGVAAAVNTRTGAFVWRQTSLEGA